MDNKQEKPKPAHQLASERKIIIVHYVFIPLLFACYPVLAIYSENILAVSFHQVLRILILSVIFSAILTCALSILFRNILKASLISIVFLIIFYSYGHIYDLVHDFIGANIGRHVFLFPLALLMIIGSGYWIWKVIKNPGALFVFFNFMIVILFGMVSTRVISHFLTRDQANDSNSLAHATPLTSNGEKPDIYYIILDGYGRQDILKGLYNFDNQDFIQFLESKGFYIASLSHSNYAVTVLSLATSLNLNYLDAIDLPAPMSQSSRAELINKVIHSRTRQILAEHGYQVVAFSNNYPTTMTDADIFFDFNKTEEAASLNQILGVHEIENMILSTTMLRALLDHGWLSGLSNNQQEFKHHYQEIKYTFENLATVPSLPGDYFICAHIVAPHPPFVFDSTGGFLINSSSYTIADGSSYKGTVDEYIKGYRNQVMYINLEVEKIIDEILSKSSPQPIIIIQGDHGPGAYLNWNSIEGTNLDERMSILNAYYFPDRNYSHLYNAITSVNTFRLLLDQYLGMNFELLEDRNYFSSADQLFNLTDVTTLIVK